MRRLASELARPELLEGPGGLDVVLGNDAVELRID